MLLDGPKKAQQLENLKTIIRNVGRAGIPVFGYNFSIAGVAGRVKGPFARGDAEAVGMDGPFDKPMPNGMVWNMVYDRNAAPGAVPSATSEQLWQRLKDFLDAVIPVAEEAGVTLAAHPDDPPMPTVRGQPRLVYQPHLYQRLIDLNPSPRNALEFCVGTLAEMTEGDIYEVVDTLQPPGQSLPTSICATCAARCRVTGDVHRRRRCGHAARAADSQTEPLRRRAHPRPRAADDLCRALARRHGLRPGLHEGGVAGDLAIVHASPPPSS